ncbi:inner membrane protein [Klebsiella pneumoniae]|nr:inner membrane protein [Klebsiella pneumoniae]
MVEEGQLAWEKLHAENMTEFEFFMELRVNSVEQLGQVRLAILETNGQISVFYYPDEEVRAGLSILPAHCTTRYTNIPQEGIYACVRCSIVMAMQAGEKRICPRCANAEWSKASRAKRLT